MSSPALPHWDMSVVFPSLTSPEYTAETGAYKTQLAELTALFDQHGIAKLSTPPDAAAAAASFEAVVAALNPLLERNQTLRAYILSFVATNSRDTLAQAQMSEFSLAAVRLSQLHVRLLAWVGSLDVEALLAASPAARTYEYFIRRAGRQAAHLMSPAEEDLAAEMGPTSGGAWGRLYNNLTSQIQVELDLEGARKTLPMSAVRNLAYEADSATRKAAYQAELASWKVHALPLAAAMNSIKGEVITLARRRAWASPLDATLFDCAIDAPTLDAMLAAARESFPHFRRYLRTKARLLGCSALPWYDLFAPVGAGRQAWPYDSAQALIVEQFSGYSPRMGEFAARAFRENWIDAEPRDGKRDGAFCMGLRAGESRVLTNYQPGFKSVLTLAHELGHAYHNLNLARQPMLSRDTPMTLAETASIFCETIVRNALLRQLPAAEQLGILEASLVNATQVVVDISSRFIFEQSVFERRARRDLSIDELCQAMLAAQQETYGDGLDAALLHPYMWAAKPHYYSTDRSYYNFPYMFGLLFGLGLYARYQQDPEDFKARYDNLLSSTGLADAAGLASGMGIDLHSIDFWRASLNTVKADIDQFEILANPA